MLNLMPLLFDVSPSNLQNQPVFPGNKSRLSCPSNDMELQRSTECFAERRLEQVPFPGEKAAEFLI